LVAAKNFSALAVENGVLCAMQSWMRPVHKPFDVDFLNMSKDAEQAASFVQAANWLAHAPWHIFAVSPDGLVDRAG